MRHGTLAERILLATSIVVAIGCGSGVSGDPSAEPRLVEVETVGPQLVVPTLSVPGRVATRSRLALSFAAGGTLARVVSAGAVVQAGARVAELVGEGEEALRAPVAGTVEPLLAEREWAPPGAPVAILAVLDRVSVRATVAEASGVRLRVGGPATVRAASGSGPALPATVTRARIDARGGARTLELELDLANPDLSLRPGDEVNVALPTGPPRSAIAVPVDAVLRGAGGRPFSFVVSGRADGLRVVRRVVALGPVHGGRVIVHGGLAAGERVVTGGQRLVTVGDRVRLAPH